MVCWVGFLIFKFREPSGDGVKLRLPVMAVLVNPNRGGVDGTGVQPTMADAATPFLAD